MIPLLWSNFQLFLRTSEEHLKRQIHHPRNIKHFSMYGGKQALARLNGMGRMV